MVQATRVERRAAIRRPRRDLADAELAPAPKASRALVVVDSARVARPPMALWHNHSPFIAQLIATAGGFAQTRPRRRAVPAEVVLSYGAFEARQPNRSSGRRVHRAV